MRPAVPRPQVWLLLLLLLLQVALPGLHRAWHHAHPESAAAADGGCGHHHGRADAGPGERVVADDGHGHPCWLCVLLAQPREVLPAGPGAADPAPAPCLGQVPVLPAAAGAAPTWTTPPSRGPPTA